MNTMYYYGNKKGNVNLSVIFKCKCIASNLLELCLLIIICYTNTFFQLQNQITKQIFFHNN